METAVWIIGAYSVVLTGALMLLAWKHDMLVNEFLKLKREVR